MTATRSVVENAMRNAKSRGYPFLRKGHRDGKSDCLGGVWVPRLHVKRIAFATLCLLAGSACVAPARSFSAYEGKAVDTARSTLSAVQTADLGIATAKRDGAFS